MSNRSLVWKNHQQDILNEIVQTGKVQPKYLHSSSKRICATSCTVCCLATACLPCVLWDTLCCCFSICFRKNPCRWGLSYKFVDQMHEAAYLDTRTQELKTITRPEILPEDLYQVALAYFTAIEQSLKDNKPTHANIIRGKLVTLISKYSPIIDHAFLQDTGDLQFLKFIIRELRP